MIIGGYEQLPIGKTVVIFIHHKELDEKVATPVYVKRKAMKEEYIKQQLDRGIDESESDLLSRVDSIFYEVLLN